MNLNQLLLTKLLFSKQDQEVKGTPIIIKIARVAIALGIAVMLISVSVVTGFQHAIRDKVSGFGAHITIANYDNNESLEPVPISSQPEYLPALKQIIGIKHIQNVATKAGILKVKGEIEGVIVKGVGADFDFSFFEKSIVAGKIFPTSDTAKSKNFLISQDIANKLNLLVGDPVEVYFIQNNDRLIRKFRITGIYKTGFSDYDKVYVLADIAHIKRLNNWKNEQTGVFEISVNNFEDIDKVADEVNQFINFDQKVTTIKEQRPWIFDWLMLLDTNAIIVIILMLIVSSINIISAILTLIIEKTSEIGLLKTMGMQNKDLQKLFFQGGLKIATSGIIWGNIIGIGLLVIQYYTHIIKLDEANYYVNYITVNLAWQNIVLINFISITFLLLSIAIPILIITSVNPLKAIKYK